MESLYNSAYHEPSVFSYVKHIFTFIYIIAIVFSPSVSILIFKIYFRTL